MFEIYSHAPVPITEDCNNTRRDFCYLQQVNCCTMAKKMQMACRVGVKHDQGTQTCCHSYGKGKTGLSKTKELYSSIVFIPSQFYSIVCSPGPLHHGYWAWDHRGLAWLIYECFIVLSTCTPQIYYLLRK